MRLLLFIAALLGLAAPARADVTGTWRDRASSVSLIVEVAENGNARLEFVGRPYYLLIRGGAAYMVFSTGAGITVAPLADLERALAEYYPNLSSRVDIPRLGQLAERGPAWVWGRQGTAFHTVSGGAFSAEPAVTISRDRALAPLAGPILRLIDHAIAMLRTGGSAAPASVLRLREIFAGGAPLSFSGNTLDRVSTTRIDPKRFAFPALPQTYQQLRAGAFPIPSFI